MAEYATPLKGSLDMQYNYDPNQVLSFYWSVTLESPPSSFLV